MRSRSVPLKCTERQNMVSLPIGNIKKYPNNGKVTVTQSEEEKMNWLRQILEWQRDMSDNKEFLSLLKSDLDLFFRKRLLFHSGRRCKDPAKRLDSY